MVWFKMPVLPATKTARSLLKNIGLCRHKHGWILSCALLKHHGPWSKISSSLTLTNAETGTQTAVSHLATLSSAAPSPTRKPIQKNPLTLRHPERNRKSTNAN